MAVIDGNVMAINPGEEAKMQMFIWNNIFFSLGFDVRDHYKELGGDAAAFVAPVRLVLSTNIIITIFFRGMICKVFACTARWICLDCIRLVRS